MIILGWEVPRSVPELLQPPCQATLAELVGVSPATSSHPTKYQLSQQSQENMKTLLGLVWISAALRSFVTCQEAPLYIQDDSPNPPTSKAPSISPATARLLLAQRLGLSQYHDLGDVDETTLDVLNTYGGPQQSAFGEEAAPRQQSPDKLLFIIEGVEYPEGRPE